ncbi:hypothetical protein BS78_10G263300 [Paspalum vaginatum]|nr:hypothetical protein BS78_10G263300 [Paspalum vaginatum]
MAPQFKLCSLHTVALRVPATAAWGVTGEEGRKDDAVANAPRVNSSLIPTGPAICIEMAPSSSEDLETGSDLHDCRNPHL